MHVWALQIPSLAIIKNKILDLQLPRSWVYNIFKKTREKKFSESTSWGGKFNEKMNFNLEIISQRVI